MKALIPFPEISPELISFSLLGMEFALRWYALAYIAGLLLGWWMIVQLMRRPALWPDNEAPMKPRQVEDLLTWIILGVVIGGRLGFVLFYNAGHYLSHPAQILAVWEGGMSFHGGFLGVIVAAWIYARKRAIPRAQLADALALAAPAGLLFGRFANFINAELWGRATDVGWGMKFPSMCQDPVVQGCAAAGEWFYYGDEVARHPSQLYEAALEGLLLGILLWWLAFAMGALKRPGLITGVFLAGYGMARFLVEFFREPDQQFMSLDNPAGHVLRLGDLGVTMGQVLSLPMIIAGVGLIFWSRRALRET